MRQVTGAALLLAAACVAPAPLAASDPVGPGYSVGGGEWSSGGGITVVARAVEQRGGTLLCGVWMTDRQSALSVLWNEDVMRAGTAFAGGVRLANGLGILGRIAWDEDLRGVMAPCFDTGVAWQPAFAAAPLAIRFPRLS